MPSISIIAPDSELADLCKKVIGNIKTGIKISIFVAPALQGVETARQEVKKGVEVIISRGGTSTLIENAKLGIPVVDIGISYQNLLYSLSEAKKYGTTVAMIGYKNVFQSIKKIDKHLEELTGIKIIARKVNNDEEIYDVMHRIFGEENSENLVFIGGSMVAKTATDLGCASVALKSTEENIIQAIEEAQKIINATRAEKERANMFKGILDHISDGVISVDKNGRITVFNKAAQTIMKADEKSLIGNEVSSTFLSSRIHDVVKQGKPELGVLDEMGGITVVTNSTPIFVDNHVVGAVATFQDVTYLQQLEQQVRRKLARQGLIPKYKFENIIGKSAGMKNVIQRAEKFADTDYTILITAETGSGKEIFAHSIHSTSKRAKGPFVTINCASLPESLLEAELFGYSEGAFTGASKGGRAGLFEQAHGGTIFLDEVGEISGRLQILFLRVLQEKEIRRIGDSRIIPVDVRIISASNRKLKELVSQGGFREDLYYRLNVLNLSIPPLRERQEDIPLLVNHFLSMYPSADRRNTVATPEAMKLLQQYEWPGNVRQLENIIQRLMVIAENELSIEPADVIQAMEGELSNHHDLNNYGEKVSATSNEYNNLFRDFTATSNGPAEANGKTVLDKGEGLLSDIENEAILKVLRSVNGNRQEAARILGISSTTLWRRLKKIGTKV
ncbi:MAG: sigma 54-interacting transcriptional regulator [Bacillota bacterium]|nr:sigma 54-interacting transcriptional regulator [Bacillota bacterium]